MSKNIVICCDGTSNQFGKNNTNVVKIYDIIVEDKNQLNFYDPGVGTTSNSILIPIRKIQNIISQALGSDLQQNVEDAYRYLMNTYEDGDKIFLFGFSRGAHTVRRLADILWKYGLLYRGSDNIIPYVSRMYEKSPSSDIIKSFRSKFTRRCPVHFLGVWDTVSALSYIIPSPKLDGILSDEISYAYHAVAIDEMRRQFPANIFRKQTSSSQTIEEVWFAGVHSDIGGSYVEQELSNITLKWMTEKAMLAGLRFYPNSFEKIESNPKGTIHNSWNFAFMFVPWPLYIFISIALILILQIALAHLSLFWPELFTWRPFNPILKFVIDYWYTVILGLLLIIPYTRKQRDIPEGSHVHESVKFRMEDAKLKYMPVNLKRILNSIKWVSK